MCNPTMSIKKQKRIFKSIFHILKPDGIFYLGIQNKLSLAFLARYKAVLPYTHLRLGNTNTSSGNVLQSIIFKIKYYKAHPLCYWRYANLLTKLGFNDVSAYGAPQNLNSPCVISLQNNIYNYYCQNVSSPRKVLKRNLNRFFNILRISKFFCHSHILIARKPSA